ncbi:MAG: protein-L-isoaspartate O-methyltransferase [Woeseiaceae bacterium]|nr:protein-L-isoaspartate O-methyltransferase [Woeseiaceae bacterium]
MNIDFARQQMIDQQIRAWTILDPDVLDVLVTTPREQFVPPAYESLAFADMEIPLGRGQSMMTPTLEGRVLQSLELNRDDSILEIGTGSGFLTACLARLADFVTSIDIHDEFVQNAAANLNEAGIENATLTTMDATQELPAGRYNAIVVTASVQTLDTRFIDALQPGGRLFIVVGSAPVMDARLVRRADNSRWHSESLFETELTPLVNSALPPQFSF